MSITIKEIAQLANTSRGTVDRVLNNRTGVNKETKERILKIIEQYNYETNKAASSLAKSKKTYKIAVLTNSKTSDYASRIKNGIIAKSRFLKERQIYLNYIDIEYNVVTQITKLDEIQHGSYDGLIVTPLVDPRVQESINNFNIPVITTGFNVNTNDLYYIGCRYFNNGQIAGDVANAILQPNQKALIINEDKTNGNYNRRVEGFQSSLLSEHDLINLEKDYNVISTSLIKNDYRLIYIIGTSRIKEILDTLKLSNYKNKIITIDEHPEIIKNIKEGYVSVTITSQPEKQGYYALEKMVEYLLHKNKPNDRRFIIGNKIKFKHSNFDEVIWNEKGEENEKD